MKPVKNISSMPREVAATCVVAFVCAADVLLMCSSIDAVQLF